MTGGGLFADLVGQERVVEQLQAAARDAAATLARHEPGHGATTRSAGAGR